MTYAATGMGAYYADTPGFQLPVEAIGAINFGAGAVWSDIQAFMSEQRAADAVGPGYTMSDSVIAGTRRAANRIRAALAQLGFGPDLQMDVPWGSGADCAAFGLFLDTMSLARVPGPCGGVSKAQLDTLEALVAEQNRTGKTPGPLAIVEYHETSPGTFVKGPAPGQKPLAGSGGGNLMLLALLAAGAVGAYFLLRGRWTYKRTTTYASNRGKPAQHRRTQHRKKLWALRSRVYGPKWVAAQPRTRRGY